MSTLGNPTLIDSPVLSMITQCKGARRTHTTKVRGQRMLKTESEDELSVPSALSALEMSATR